MVFEKGRHTHFDIYLFEKGSHTHFDIYLNNAKLEIVTPFKYLGIHFFKSGDWYRALQREHNMLHFLYIIYSFFFEKLNLRPLRNVNYLTFWLNRFDYDSVNTLRAMWRRWSVNIHNSWVGLDLLVVNQY